MIIKINMIIWFMFLCYFMYQRVIKSPKTWRDYADMGLIIVFMLIDLFFLVIYTF